MFPQTPGITLGDRTVDTAGLSHAGATVVLGAPLALIITAYYWTRVSRTLLF